MKVKIFTSFAVVVLFFWALTITLAQESVPLQPNPTPNPVNYELPYPGLLSDHPLFIFKKARDLILTHLISNSIKKIEFQILLADKYMHMSTMMLDKGNTKATIESIKSSVSHMDTALELMSAISSEDQLHRNNVMDRFELSLRKHLEVVQTIGLQINDERASEVVDLEKQLQSLYDQFLSQK